MDTLILSLILKIIKINNFRGDLSDISAATAMLLPWEGGFTFLLPDMDKWPLQVAVFRRRYLGVPSGMGSNVLLAITTGNVFASILLEYSSAYHTALPHINCSTFPRMFRLE